MNADREFDGTGRAKTAPNRREAIGRLTHFWILAAAAQLGVVRRSSGMSGNCGDAYPTGGVYADHACGGYQDGLLHADVACGASTGHGADAREDASCGLALGRDISLAGNDQDCGAVSPHSPGTHTDAACGLPSTENPHSSYWNDIVCGWLVSPDADCGLAKDPTHTWVDNASPLCQFPD